MADDKLARSMPDSGLASRLEPTVLTKATPTAEWLLEARRTINRDEEIRTFIRNARAEGVDADTAVDGLCIRLNARWGGERAEEAFQAAQYLWDEQSQLGEGFFITSTETGKVIAAITEKDIYVPAPVPREGGGLAQPLPRIRPDLEAAITCWAHDKGREEQLLQTLAARAHQTDLLREDGDPRLLVATKAGRRHIVNEFSKFDPKVLMRAAGGTSGAFLQHFELLDKDPFVTTGLHFIDGLAFSQSVMGVQDMTTANLHHNRAASLQGALVQGWIREMARQLSLVAARSLAMMESRAVDLAKPDLGNADFWICPPEALRYIRKADPKVGIMPVVSAAVLGLRPRVGYIVVPKDFEATSREMFDRWEAHSNLSFRLWVNWDAVRPLRLTGIEHQAIPT